jgi:predicted RNase H-like nuclease (RuvC/YqgF family)
MTANEIVRLMEENAKLRRDLDEAKAEIANLKALVERYSLQARQREKPGPRYYR